MANASDENVVKDTVQDEINFLRDYFKENIRILSSIGQFSYILKIRVDQYDVSITLQLDESYPTKAPEIIITAPRLTPEQVSHIQQLLQSYSETLLNKRMVQPIYSRLLDWCAENHIQSLETTTTNNAATNAGHSHRSSANPTPTSTPTSGVNPAEALKKSAMKTAEDVISRIEWDTRLDKRYFRVGYVDRFLGLQEKAFNEFDFKVDLSTVSDRHSSVLAIPKHRIQYFKYNTEIVWDKETRTDLMFGSTGNQQTIYDVIERHEALMRGNHVERTPEGDEPIEEGNTSVTPPRYLTLTDGAYKPNYFLSIPITDSTVTANYVAYRDHLLSTFPNCFSLRSATTTTTNEPVELHVTLVTLYLESSTAVDKCVVALKKLQEQIRYHCSYPERLCLEFDGIDTFYDRVVLVKCTPNQRLENLRTLIVERLTEKQNLTNIFFAGNYYEFVPHITLMKCKRKFSSLGSVAQPEKPFGKQMLNSLQLCSIGSAEQDESGSKCVFALDLS